MFIDCHTCTCNVCSLIVVHIHMHYVCCHTYSYHTMCSFTFIHNASTIAITSPQKNDLCTQPKIGRVQRSFIVVTFYYAIKRCTILKESWIGFRMSGFLNFQNEFLDFTVDFWNSMDFWISAWISGFHSGFVDFSLDFWTSQWISGFQFGFLPTMYEISFVTDPSLQPLLAVHGCSSPHMTLQWGYKFTNFTAVASFSGHFLHGLGTRSMI